MPIAPMQYPMLNFMPAIQVLKSNQKQPAASSASKTKEDDVDVEGVKGHVEQWQDLYDTAKNKASKILAHLGEDAVKDPYYKKAISEINQLESPGVKNTLKEYKSNLERYKANTKDKGTLFNLEEGFKTGVFSTFNYWSNYLDQSQTQDIGRTDETANPWYKNFNWNPTAFSIDDAVTQIKENNKTGQSESNYKTSRNNIEEFAKGEMAGLLKVHNTNTTSYRSNINKFGERNMVEGQVVTEKGPDGKPLPVDRGQLDYALEENQRKAFQAFNLADKINQGLFQDFAARTSSGVPSIDREMSNERHAFRSRLDLGLTEEQSRVLDQTLDGYYYKPGTVRDGVDVSGQLDEETMMNDYKNHANGILASEYNVAIQEFKSEMDDSDWAFYNMNEEQTRNWYAAQEAAAFAAGAHQSQTTISSKTDQGYTEDDLKNMLGSDEDDTDFLSDPLGVINSWIFGKDESEGNQAVEAAFGSGSISPFETIVGSDGNKRFIPKAGYDFDSGELRNKIWQKTKDEHPDWTTADLNNAVDKQMQKINKLYNEANNRRYSESGIGDERIETTQLEWSSQAVDADFITILQNAFFTKGADGQLIGKTANQVLSNLDVKVGETVTNGASLFGNIPIVSIGNNLKLGAFGLASNAGVVTQKEIVIDGKKIPAGQFIHLSTLDGLGVTKTNELFKSGAIFSGSGYWKQVGNSWKDGQAPDRTSVQSMGTVSESILNSINADVQNNPQAVVGSASQYYSTFLFGGDEKTVLKDLETKEFMTDVPQYATTPNGKATYDEVQGLINDGKLRIRGAKNKDAANDLEAVIEENADALGLKGRNREEYKKSLYASVDKTGHLKYGKLAEISGKYAGQQKYQETDWSTKPVMAKRPVMVKGKVDQAFKNTTGWYETGSDGSLFSSGNKKVYFYGDVNVTQGLYNGNAKTKKSVVSGHVKLQENRVASQKSETQKKELVLPNVNARK